MRHDDRQHIEALLDFCFARGNTVLRVALRHEQIIRRFGRFLHRNAVLGRATRLQEAAFLTEPDAAF
jgi:uncharacterized protein (DUF924 family)